MLSVDWERSDTAGGKMRNAQVSWHTVTKRNGMEEKTKSRQMGLPSWVWKQNASLALTFINSNHCLCNEGVGVRNRNLNLLKLRHFQAGLLIQWCVYFSYMTHTTGKYPGLFNIFNSTTSTKAIYVWIHTKLSRTGQTTVHSLYTATTILQMSHINVFALNFGFHLTKTWQNET